MCSLLDLFSIQGNENACQTAPGIDTDFSTSAVEGSDKAEEISRCMNCHQMQSQVRYAVTTQTYASDHLHGALAHGNSKSGIIVCRAIAGWEYGSISRVMISLAVV